MAIRSSIILFCAVLAIAMFSIEIESVSVKISGRTMYVNGSPYWAKGVNYGVVPVGQTIGSFNGKSWDWQSTAGVYNRDLPNIKAMGANTIRTYTWRQGVNHNAFLDACVKNGITVTIGFAWNWNDFNGGSSGRQRMRDNVVAMVKNHAKHSAVLMWAVGNELNASGRGYQPSVWSFIGELKDLIHKTEAAMGVWHPVCSPLADGSSMYDIIRNANSKVDVWAVQLYRGKTFYDFFTRYAALSSKPMFITEFGVDSYVAGASTSSAEQQQADWVAPMYTEMTKNTKVCSGGYVFSWVDAWWKCSGLSRSVQDKCPKAAGKRFPGGEVNEEWFGLNAIVNTKPSSTGVDTVRKKAGFYKVQALYKQSVSLNRLDNETDIIPVLPEAEVYNFEENPEIAMNEDYDPLSDGIAEAEEATKRSSGQTTKIAAGVAGSVGGLLVVGAAVGFVIFKRRSAGPLASKDSCGDKEQELAATPSQAHLLVATPSESELVANASNSQADISPSSAV